MSQETSNSSSITMLLRELRDDTTTLLRQEVALAKTELKENVSHLKRDAVQIAIGGFVAYAGLIVLLIGLSLLLAAVLVRAGLDPDVARWAGHAIIGFVVAIIGWMMLAKAKRDIEDTSIAPRQTMESMRENKEWAQRKIHHSS
jgi:hypothetical protein